MTKTEVKLLYNTLQRQVEFVTELVDSVDQHVDILGLPSFAAQYYKMVGMRQMLGLTEIANNKRRFFLYEIDLQINYIELRIALDMVAKAEVIEVKCDCCGGLMDIHSAHYPCENNTDVVLCYSCFLRSNNIFSNKNKV